MGPGEVKKDFKNYLSGKKLKCGPIKHKLLKMMSDYSSVHDRNDTQGNEYINRFFYSVVYFMLVTDLACYAS